MPAVSTVNAVCSKCGEVSQKKASTVRASTRKNGAYMCSPCLRSTPEARARAASGVAHLRKPHHSEVTCTDCGEVSTVTKSALKYHGGAHQYRCVACGQKAGIEKRRLRLSPVAKTVRMMCACGATAEISRHKWLTKWKGKESQWSCRSCSSRRAYNTGRCRGTKGMRFVEVTLRDRLDDQVAVSCPQCDNTRMVTVETALRLSGLGQGTVRRDMPSTFLITCSPCAMARVAAGLRLTQEAFQDKWRAMPEGTRLIQIFEDEWRDKRALVEQMLRNRMGITGQKLYARSTQVLEVPKESGRVFLGVNHIQGADAAQRYFALHHGGTMVACMSFARPSLAGGSRKVDWHIGRFASRADLNLPGGFSKLFSFAAKALHANRVGTYADLRWGNGDVYRKNGFSFSHYTAPNYFYVRPQRHPVRLHRFGFRKSMLRRMLGESFQEELTERENANKLGLSRVYDAGNAYFEWRR